MGLTAEISNTSPIYTASAVYGSRLILIGYGSASSYPGATSTTCTTGATCTARADHTSGCSSGIFKRDLDTGEFAACKHT